MLVAKSFLILSLGSFATFPLWADSLKSCDDAKPSGVCSGIVETGINVCEANQSEKPITAKTLKNAQETKFNKGTNFGKLVSKYKDASKSAKKDADKQKLCQKAMKSLKSDCNNLCNLRGGASCEDGKDELDDLRKFCKKNEDAANKIAAIADQDAAMFSQNLSGGDAGNNGTNGPGGAGSGAAELGNVGAEGNLVGYIGEAGTRAITGMAGFTLDEPTDSAGGANGGEGAGGANGGSGVGAAANGGDAGGANGGGGATKDAAFGGNGLDGLNTASAKRISGTGATNLSEGAEETTRRDGAGAYAISGNSPLIPGNMLIGTPGRKRKITNP